MGELRAPLPKAVGPRPRPAGDPLHEIWWKQASLVHKTEGLSGLTILAGVLFHPWIDRRDSAIPKVIHFKFGLIGRSSEAVRRERSGWAPGVPPHDPSSPRPRHQKAGPSLLWQPLSLRSAFQGICSNRCSRRCALRRKIKPSGCHGDQGGQAGRARTLAARGGSLGA